MIGNVIISFFILYMRTYLCTYTCCPVIKFTQHSFLQRQYTPLLLAAEKGQTKVVETLLRKGASTEARNDVS